MTPRAAKTATRHRLAAVRRLLRALVEQMPAEQLVPRVRELYALGREWLVAIARHAAGHDRVRFLACWWKFERDRPWANWEYRMQAQIEIDQLLELDGVRGDSPAPRQRWFAESCELYRCVLAAPDATPGERRLARQRLQWLLGSLESAVNSPPRRTGFPARPPARVEEVQTWDAVMQARLKKRLLDGDPDWWTGWKARPTAEVDLARIPDAVPQRAASLDPARPAIVNNARWRTAPDRIARRKPVRPRARPPPGNLPSRSIRDPGPDLPRGGPPRCAPRRGGECQGLRASPCFKIRGSRTGL